MNIPLMDLKRQIEPLRERIDQAIGEIIDNTAFVGGTHIKEFERKFAEAHNAQYCIGVGNGTDAITISLMALGIGRGAEVLVPANTFIATSEAVSAAGARPVFVDVDPDDYLMDVRKVEQILESNPKIKAIIPVHLYGRMFDLNILDQWRQKYRVAIIEDAAQAHLGKFGPRNIAEVTDAATFSFYPGKNLGAFGDAGAVITNDQSLAEKIRMLANHGRTAKYHHEFEGFNSRMDHIQAAVLNIKLEKLEEWTVARNLRAFRYNDHITNSSIIRPEIVDYPQHVNHLYVIRHKNRDRLQEYLKEYGIASQIHYPVALPFTRAYAKREAQAQDFPMAHRLQDEILSIPLFAEMTDQEQDYVIDKLNQFELA